MLYEKAPLGKWGSVISETGVVLFGRPSLDERIVPGGAIVERASDAYGVF